MMELIWFQNKTIQVMLLAVLMQGSLLGVSARTPTSCPKDRKYKNISIYPKQCPMPYMPKEMTACCDRNYQPRCCTDMKQTKCVDHVESVGPFTFHFFTSCYTETKLRPWQSALAFLGFLLLVAAVTSCCCCCFCREFFKSVITCRRCRSNQPAYDRI